MVELVGHRGAASHEPENTLRSFDKAIKLGVDAIEFDVHLTKDGKLVVIHDKTVDRTTNGKGSVKDLILSQIRRLDAGKGERIPILQEVLDLAHSRVGMQIELKGQGTELPVAGLISKYKADNIHLISFNHRMLANVKNAFPKIRTGVLVSHLTQHSIAVMKSAGAEMMSINHSALDRRTVDLIQSHNKRICAWTVNEPAEMRKLIRMGIDAIVSDIPDLAAIQLLRS